MLQSHQAKIKRHYERHYQSLSSLSRAANARPSALSTAEPSEIRALVRHLRKAGGLISGAASKGGHLHPAPAFRQTSPSEPRRGSN